jgi:catechol 2,3-dioxygenase-like lactoylglutathione lyase family enzyme
VNRVGKNGRGMELQNIDQPKTGRERVAEWVGLLVKNNGSQARLAQTIVDAEPKLQGLTRDDISAWVNSRTLPEEIAAQAISKLLQEHGNEFLEHWRAARLEHQSEIYEEVDLALPRGISVLGIVWLGVCSEDLDAACRFYEDILRLRLVHRCERGHAIFRTVNGDFVALFGPQTDRYKLFTTGPVVGFRVGNITAARAEMERRGVMFLGPTLANDNGRWKYAHYLGPDGRVYEIVEEDPWPEN